MKKNTARKNPITAKAILFTSAATLALTTTAYAQSSDALIDKLVDKGILSTKEAQDLREESDADFKTAMQAKTGMPDWVNSYSLNGSVRGRYEHFSSDNSSAVSRDRFRYRVLVGMKVNMLDDLEAGFRLGSGDVKGSTGNPLSQNSTMTDNFSDKGIYIDLAYGKWSPIHNANWQLSATVGKMENPFQFTPMVFDQDLTPEGAAFQGGYTINDQHSIAFTGAAFILDEESSSTKDPFMYGGQVMWNAKWTPKWSSSLGVGAFEIMDSSQLSTANVTLINYGNTRVPYTYTPPGGGSSTTLSNLRYNFSPFIADASVTYTLDTFPLYVGTFPIKLQAEFMDNPSAPDGQNKGYWIGFTLGKSGAKKTWDISYRYEYLESDAWYDQLVDDDNVAYYSGNMPYYGASTTANAASPGSNYVGGTNIKGHLVKFNYSFTDSLTFSCSCFINDLINSSVLQPVPGIANIKPTSAIHFFADVMWKF